MGSFTTRRKRLCLSLSVALLLPLFPGNILAQTDAARAWASVPEILARIVAPTFPDREFDITKFGARGDGTTDCTAAFAKAIAACNKSGGGKVIVPAGNYLTGAIHLNLNEPNE